jgi:hypothetical protein
MWHVGGAGHARDHKVPDGEDGSDLVNQGPERVFLVGAAIKRRQKKFEYSIQESLEELGRLAETAGLEACPLRQRHLHG